MKKRILALLLSGIMMVSGSVTALATDGESLGENTLGEEVVLEIPLEETDDAELTEASEESSSEDLWEIEIEDEETEESDVTDIEEIEVTDSEDVAETAEEVEDIIYPKGYSSPESSFKVQRGEAYDEAELEETYASKYVTSKLPPLRDQSPYGTCWAFASISLLEINLMKTGVITNPDLSELHLAYFNYNSVVDPLKGTEGDSVVTTKKDLLDKGGNFLSALETMQKWTGAASESKVPYSMAKTAMSSGLSTSLAYDDTAHVTNYYLEQVDLEKFRSNKNISSLNPLKKMLMDCGAIGMCFGAVDSRSAYTTDKIYNSTYGSYYNPNYEKSNHAVIIVGWDDNFSRYNFSHYAPGNGAWLVRNSWTTKGSVDKPDYTGYFWMSYYEPSIEDSFYGVKASTATNYQNNYQYDGYFDFDIGYKQQGANVFTAHAAGGSKGETLKAVSFMSLAFSTSYKIEIYKDVVDKPTSGILVSSATTSGTTNYAGYHTIPLAKAVELKPNSKFAVVVTLGSESLCYDVSKTKSGYKISAGQNQSFYKSGSSWYSFSHNFKIKAYTNNSSSSGGDDPAPTPTPTKPTSVKLTAVENGTDKYKIKIEYNPSNYVPKSIKWSSSDTNTATVDNQGNVTMKNIGYSTITANVDGVEGSTRVKKDLPENFVTATAGADGSVTLKWKSVYRASDYIVYRYEGVDSTEIKSFKNDGKTTDYEYTDTFYKGDERYGGKYVSYSVVVVINGNKFYGYCHTTLPSQEELEYIWVVEYEREDGRRQLVARFKPYLYVPRGKIVWKSSDESVGVIDQEGYVTFKDVGDVTFTATVDGVSGSLQYTINPNLALEQSMGKVKITWPKSKRAKSYELYRETGAQEKICTLTNSGSGNSLTFTDTYFYYNPLKKSKTVHYLLRINADFGNGETYRDYPCSLVVLPRGTATDDEDGWGDVTDSTLKSKFDNNPANIPYDCWYVFNGEVYKGARSLLSSYAVTYTGSKITFDDKIAVYYGKHKLAKSADYKISYSGNVNVNNAESRIPTVTLKGKGNYSFTRNIYFNIKPASLSKASIASETVVTVAKGSKKLGDIKPKVTFNDKKLKKGKDYELVYRNASGEVIDKPAKEALKEVGARYTIEIKSAEDGNFTGTISEKVTVLVINSKETKTASDFKLGDVDGNALKFKFGDIMSKSDVEKYFASREAMVYHKKTALVYGTDYNVQLIESDYTSVGTHSVRIIAKESKDSEYRGSKILTFKVLPYDITLDGEKRLVIETGPARYSSNGAVPMTNVYFKGLDGKTIKLEKGVDYTVSYKNNKKVASANAAKAPTVVIKGKGRLTGTKTKTFSIHK